MQLEALRRKTAVSLAKVGVENAALEARLLCELAFGLTASDSITKALNDFDEAKLSPLLQRRLNGEPLQRLKGLTEFYGLEFSLNEATLIPRADTEILVDEALKHISPNAHILDLGTGTGCIVISLLHKRKNWTGVASDISEQALDVTFTNAKANHVSERLKLVHSDWFSAIEGQFDLILSNPPYIAFDEAKDLSKEVLDHDPHKALFAENNGLAAYEAIFSQAKPFLKPHGRIIVEIGYQQTSRVRAIAEKHTFLFEDLSLDYAKNPRVLTFSRN